MSRSHHGSSDSQATLPSRRRRSSRTGLRMARRAAAFRTTSLWRSTIRPWLEFAARFLLAMAAAIIIPIVVQDTPPHGPPRFTVGEQVVLGGLVLVAGLLLGNTFELKVLANTAVSREIETLSEISRDNDLRRCLDGLEQVSRLDRSRLLEILLSRTVHELGNSIKTVADTLEYELEPRIDETEVMLQCSQGGTCRMVHYLDNTDFLISNKHSIEFWLNLDNAVQQKEIKKVERLLLVNSDPDLARDELDARLNRLLVGAHLDHPEYECRILGVNYYEELLEQRLKPVRRLDCGIYANRFVYISYQLPGGTEGSKPEVAGRLVAHPEKVEQYRRFLEECWGHAKPPAAAQELYNLDAFTENTLEQFLEAGGPTVKAAQTIST
jgi:hypothetical protein